MRKALLSIVVLLLLSLPLAGCGLIQDFQSVQSVADEFMTALKDREYPAAFDLFSTDLREEVGSPANLGDLAETNGILPQKWNYTNTEISTEDGQTIGSVEGTVTYVDGGEGNLEIYVLKVEAATVVWKIIGFNLTR
jgi:hypothetical protein